MVSFLKDMLFPRELLCSEAITVMFSQNMQKIWGFKKKWSLELTITDSPFKSLFTLPLVAKRQDEVVEKLLS